MLRKGGGELPLMVSRLPEADSDDTGQVNPRAKCPLSRSSTKNGHTIGFWNFLKYYPEVLERT